MGGAGVSQKMKHSSLEVMFCLEDGMKQQLEHGGFWVFLSIHC